MSPGTIRGIKSHGTEGKQGTDVAGFPGIKEARVLGRIYTISPRQGRMFLPSTAVGSC